MAEDTETEAPAAAPPLAPEPDHIADAGNMVVDPRADAISAAVRLWQVNHLGNSPVSRIPEAWAHVNDALPALVASILKEV